MQGLQHIRRIRDYCDYIEEHLCNVSKAWAILQRDCADMHPLYDDHLWSVIDQMILEHDISKMSYEEFIPYQQNFFPVGEKDGTRFEAAWEHHALHNPHHWENWTKAEESFPNESACHCVCMVCDWMAMGMKFGDTAESYYAKHSARINLPEWADKLVREIFVRLAL